MGDLSFSRDLFKAPLRSSCSVSMLFMFLYPYLHEDELFLTSILDVS